MLTGIHILLTYTCNFECDHCFLYCGPRAQGTFSLEQLSKVLDEASKIGTVESIYFEGGEPFLFFPIMIEGIKRARQKGFDVGVVTNAYGALTEEDARFWLRPLLDAGVSELSISNDSFHYGEEKHNPASVAASVAKEMGIEVYSICIDQLEPDAYEESQQERGRPVVGGGPKFRGRAVDKLTKGLSRRSHNELILCPYEDLVSPSRVHVDPHGHVHLCQGLSMGNMWEIPLSEIVGQYSVETHPVCRPLAKGGPYQLALEQDVEPEEGYIDECHFCYVIRRTLVDRFPQYLAPRQVYGLE